MKHPTVLLSVEEWDEDPVQWVVMSSRSGMTHAEVRYQCGSRHLLHLSRKQELKWAGITL